MSARIAAAILCLWGVWSLACYQSNDDRCVPGQARCDEGSEYASYAENCVERDDGPHYFQSDFCPVSTGTCKIARDASGNARAFCALGDARDARCDAGVFADQCTPGGWIRCSNGYVSVETLCPFSGECVLDADGVGGCGEVTEPSPLCAEVEVGDVCDGAEVSVRCDAGYELSRFRCWPDYACDPTTGRCAPE